MFDRYNESARRLLFFARYSASELGSLSIDTEHLLLGLMRESKGVVAKILAAANFPSAKVRSEIEVPAAGKERISTSIEVPFTTVAKRVLQFAVEEADRLQHSYIGPEHLLLGLLRAEGSVAATLLQANGVSLDSARTQISSLVSSPSSAREHIDRIDSLLKQVSRELEELRARFNN